MGGWLDSQSVSLIRQEVKTGGENGWLIRRLVSQAGVVGHAVSQSGRSSRRRGWVGQTVSQLGRSDQAEGTQGRDVQTVSQLD
jgi:hypothetical protein